MLECDRKWGMRFEQSAVKIPNVTFDPITGEYESWIYTYAGEYLGR
jgi:hypothetical protein